MAIAEQEVIQQEVTQSITVRLTEAQAAMLRQAAAAQGQSMEDFAVTAIADAARKFLSPTWPLPAGRDPLDSIVGIFKDGPELDALMGRIHAERRLQEEAERQTADETDHPVLFTSYDGTTREVGALPADLGRRRLQAAARCCFGVLAL